MELHDISLLFGQLIVSKETIYAFIILLFSASQLGIVFEPLRIDKSVYATAGGFFIWSVLALATDVDTYEVLSNKSTSNVGSVVFFLWLTMTIVEWLDKHGVFSLLSKAIKTTDINVLIIIISWLTFIVSALLDNVTASIVMGSLVLRLIASEENQKLFAGIVVLAANIGGIASPVGNTTSIQLWSGHQLSADIMITKLLLPSIAAMLVINVYFLTKLSGRVYRPDLSQFSVSDSAIVLSMKEKSSVILFGLTCLIIGIMGKVLFHQMPWMGMGTGMVIFALGIGTWHYFNGDHYRIQFNMKGALKHVDGQTLFYFMGILLATEGLGHMGAFAVAADFMNTTIGEMAGFTGVAAAIGIASGFVSNSAIVASVQQAYPIVGDTVLYEGNHLFWQLVGFTSGAGGNFTLFGSAAGIAMMVVVPALSIGWYMKHMMLPALVAYCVGFGTFFMQEGIIHGILWTWHLVF